MMIWLWDAGRARGVTDTDHRARAWAEAFLRDGRAETARVEMAAMPDSRRALDPGYTRLGCGWTAKARPGEQVRWEPIADGTGP